MSTERLIASHLRLAAESLAGAKLLLLQGNRYTAYLAEQAVEQLVLALAQSEGVHFARGEHHQLETMRRRPSLRGSYREALARLTWLEDYATTYRYPKTAGSIADPPSPERLRVAVEETSSLLERIARHFDVDLDPASKAPASHATPPTLS